MKKQILILLILTLIPLATANPDWYQEAGADAIRGAGTGNGNSYTAYGSNYGTTATSEYTQCSYGGSDKGVVAGNIKEKFGGLPQIVVTEGNTITIYDQDCQVQDATSVTGDYSVQPIIQTTEGEAFYLLTANNTHVLQYVIDSNEFSFAQSWDTTTTCGVANITGLLCGTYPDNPYCQVLKDGTTNNCVIDLNDNTLDNKLGDPLDYIQDTTNTYTGYASGRNNAEDILQIICTGKSGSEIRCEELTDDGAKTGNEYAISYTSSVVDIQYQSAFYARLGGSMRMFASVCATTGATSPQCSGGIYDLGGTRLLENPVTTSNADNDYTNWMVADFDKDGSNDACIIVRNITGGNKRALHCWDSNLQIILDTQLGSGAGQDRLRGAVLLEYNSSSQYLDIGTVEGVWTYSLNTSRYELVYNSGVTAGISNDGRLMTIWSSSNGNSLIYYDSNTGFIARPKGNLTTCGNGLCEGLENSLVCPQDCAANITAAVGEPCTQNEDCFTGTCGSDNQCILSPAGTTCTIGTQCVSGECVGGQCTEPSLWEKINNFITLQFGDDTITLLLIGLIICAIVAISAYSFIKHVAAAGIGFVTAMIFLSTTVLIPWWFPLMIILLSGAVIVTVFMNNN